MALAVASSSVALRSLEAIEICPDLPQKNFRTAVVLKKTTRWDWEREKHPKKSESEVEAALRANGSDVTAIRASDEKQKAAIRMIVTKLQEYGIATKVVFRGQLAGCVNWADVVVSAGGDGTFLSAAAAVTDDTPVIGINTDPIGSEGHLCVGGKRAPEDLIERMVYGKFRWLLRSRIRVTLLNRKQDTKHVCRLALNEVFIGEDEAAKVSTFDISIDDQPMRKQKSSGLVVSTGTGSTSWYKGLCSVDETSVTAVLEAMAAMGIEVKAKRRELSTKIAKKINEKIPFEPDHPNFAYAIREPIFNATFPRTEVKGFARRIRIRSRCTKGYLVLDGATKIPFFSGTEALLEISPQDSLRTIAL